MNSKLSATFKSMEDSASAPFIFGDLTSVGQVMTRNAHRWPDAIGAVCAHSGREVTWDELNARCNRFAHGLIASGVTNGDCVAIFSDNRIEYAEMFFGAAKLGAVVVNINHRLSGHEVESILRDTTPRLLVAATQLLPVIAELKGTSTVLPEVVLSLGDDPGDGGFEAFIAGRPHDEPRPHRAIKALDPLAVQFSSGATGVPKGVTWSHRGAMVNALNFGYNYGLAMGARLMLSTPISAHCGMLVTGGFLGCRLIFANFDADTTLEAVERTGTQWLSLVPVLVQRLCDAQAIQRRDLSSLTDIIYGGSPISAETLLYGLDLLDCRFWQIYSLSEACMAGCVLRPEDHVDTDTETGRKRLTSCGRPYLNVAVRLLDSDGSEVGVGETGEIVIYSEGSMLGYWGSDELSARTLVDGWIMTGDIGRFDQDGYLYIVDRAKDMIISGAFNIFPAEIERVLAEHQAVAEVAVIGVPDDKWGERVHAFVVLHSTASVTEEELIEHCRSRLGGAKKPRSFDFCVSLPRNALGKVIKRELREPYWSGRERSV